MAFITKSNARKIEFQADADALNNIYLDDLYDMSLWMFSKKEQQWLAAAKSFYENPEFYINNIYEKQEPKDSFRMLFAPAPPAYHASPDCKSLHGDYNNYAVPAEVYERGELEVKRFRSWWASEMELFKTDKDRFLIRMELEFKLKNPPGLRSIEAPNSGVDEVENSDLVDVKSGIDELLHSMREFSNRHPGVIREYGKRTYSIKKGDLIVGDPEKKQILDEWHECKENLKKNLRLYFRLRFNPEIEIKESLLDAIGFVPCAHCYG